MAVRFRVSPAQRLVVEAVGNAKSVGDLFCGLGPFALRLAESARVTAFDSDRAAIAALGDDAFIKESRRVNGVGLALLKAELAKRQLETIPAFGNFITFKIENAKRVFEALLRQGVIVRPIAGYGLPDYLRVTIGTEAQNRRFLTALDKARE